MRLVGLIAAKDNNVYSTNPTNAVTVTVLLFVLVGRHYFQRLLIIFRMLSFYIS